MLESEVACLRQKLEEQARAAWLWLYGFAEVERHQAITHRMERMGASWQALAEKVGQQEATRILIEIEQRIDEKNHVLLPHAEVHQQATPGYQNG